MNLNVRNLMKNLTRTGVPSVSSSHCQFSTSASFNSSSVITSSRNMSSADSGEQEKDWLQKILTGDSTKQAASKTVGSQNLYRLVFIQTSPQHQEDYIKLGTKMLTKFSEERDDCRLVGAWKTVIGHSEEIVHLWQYMDGYKSLDDMGSEIFPHDKQYEEFEEASRPFVRSSYSQIMMQFGYFDEPGERLDKHVYELRSYKLKPGSMIEWANHWSRGIDYRKSDNQNVAGMFTHIGELNMVHHIWAYKSFQDRNRIRSNSWENSGWSKTVANTVPLIKNIKSRVMTALPYSWLK